MSTYQNGVATLVRELRAGPRSHSVSVFNFYADTSGECLANGDEIRRNNLKRYLGARQRVRLVLIGEAPGFRGARFSGVPFCDERFLYDVVREGAQSSSQRAESGKPWAEASSLRMRPLIASASVVAFNAFPWHPFETGDPRKNRRPTRGELEQGRKILQRLLRLYPDAEVVAVGQVGADALSKLSVCSAFRSIPHPASRGPHLQEYLKQRNRLMKEYGIEQTKE